MALLWLWKRPILLEPLAAQPGPERGSAGRTLGAAEAARSRRRRLFQEPLGRGFGQQQGRHSVEVLLLEVCKRIAINLAVGQT